MNKQPVILTTIEQSCRKMKFSNPAIVLGSGAVTGLGAVRSLGRAGVTVYHIDEEKTIVKYSKYLKESFVLPKMGSNKNELRRVLLELQHQIGKGAVLFPATDFYARTLADLSDELSGYYIPIAKKETIDILINKRKFYESLMDKKVPHPTSHFPENLEDARQIAKEISYPIFVKPYLSQSFAKRFRKKGFVANSEAGLIGYLAFLKRTHVDVMIQEIVSGPPTNHIFLDGYLDKDSNPKAFFARRRLRMWPLAFGNSSLCISVPASEFTSLKEMLFRYLKSIGYRGIFSAEFKMDPRNGIFKLLEINSRTSAWFNTLSGKCGNNLMLVAYLDAIGKDTQYSEDYEAGVKWIYFKDDFRSSVKMIMNGDLSVQQWISSLSGKKDYLLFASDDTGPFVMSLPHTILEVFGKRV